jgi:hypothetical protein
MSLISFILIKSFRISNDQSKPSLEDPKKVIRNDQSLQQPVEDDNNNSRQRTVSSSSSSSSGSDNETSNIPYEILDNDEDDPSESIKETTDQIAS